MHTNLCIVNVYSLGYLIENMDSTNKLSPLFEAKLELTGTNLVFVPSLNPDDPKGFNCTLADIMNDIIKICTLVPRVVPNKQTYEEIICSNTDIKEMKNEIMHSAADVVQEANDFCRTFDKYAYLWLDDRQTNMEIFLTYGRMLNSEEIELASFDDPAAPPKCPPKIESFRDQIDNYEMLFTEIENMQTVQVFNGWFQVCRFCYN